MQILHLNSKDNAKKVPVTESTVFKHVKNNFSKKWYSFAILGLSTRSDLNMLAEVKWTFNNGNQFILLFTLHASQVDYKEQNGFLFKSCIPPPWESRFPPPLLLPPVYFLPPVPHHLNLPWKIFDLVFFKSSSYVYYYFLIQHR